MTRKDYELIAAAVAEARNDEGSDYSTFDEAVDAVAERIASALRSTNPRFDVSRFLKACA
jgi:hypothetical protein